MTNMVTIQVRTLEDCRYDLYADQSDCVASIKVKLQELCGVSMDRQRIIYKGRELENNKELRAYGVPESSHDPILMHLVFKEDKTATVQFKRNEDIVWELKWDYMDENKQIIHLKRELSIALHLAPASMKKMELYMEDGRKLENIDSMTKIIQKENRTDFVLSVVEGI